MRRLATGVACAAVAVTAALVVPSSADDLERPPDARIAARGLAASTALGSYCLTTEGPSDGPIAPQGPCVDSSYPLRPKGRLPVRAGGGVLIDLRTGAKAVRGQLVRMRGRSFDFVGPSIDARHVRGGRYWRITLPDALQGANALSIDVELTEGQANFWGGLRELSR